MIDENVIPGLGYEGVLGEDGSLRPPLSDYERVNFASMAWGEVMLVDRKQIAGTKDQKQALIGSAAAMAERAANQQWIPVKGKAVRLSLLVEYVDEPEEV